MKLISLDVEKEYLILKIVYVLNNDEYENVWKVVVDRVLVFGGL